jgi:hypothetical protein
VDGRARSKPDIVTITSYNEWGRHADQAAAPTQIPSYDGAWGCSETQRQRLHDAYGVLDRPIPFGR